MMSENVKWKVDGIFKADANECYREISSLEQITPKAILDLQEMKIQNYINALSGTMIQQRRSTEQYKPAMSLGCCI